MAPKWLLAVSALALLVTYCQSGFRLPGNVLPHQYTITITPFFGKHEDDNFTFSGVVDMDFAVLEDSDNVTFHALELDIQHLAVSERGSVTRDEEVYDTEWKCFKTQCVAKPNRTMLPDRRYTLHVEYSAKLPHGNFSGFFWVKYTEKNVTRWIAATQFETTHARRAFPCLDEPAFKARVAVRINRTKDMQSFSNMPILMTKEVDSERELDIFETSPVPMSTYLVAWVVAPKHQILTNMYGNVSVAGQIETSRFGEYALRTAEEVVRFMEEYTEEEYPLPKLDHIEVPDMAGAMENWGLITYENKDIQFDPANPHFGKMAEITLLMAHEIAHQWFGNLVTNSWWQHVWLNEGFATYFQYLATDAIRPTWRTLDSFQQRSLHSIMEDDISETNYKALSSECDSEEDFDNKMGLIDYQKGASIIRMFHLTLPRGVFQKGVRSYLKTRRLSTAEPRDLFDAFQRSLPVNHSLPRGVEELFGSWVTQPKYPVVVVTREYDENGTVTVKQVDEWRNITDYKWWVPLTWTTEKESLAGVWDTVPDLWLPPDEEEMQIEGVTYSHDNWLVFNNLQAGYYRVHYDTKNWALLALALNSDNYALIHPLNRAQLLDDSLTLAEIDILPVTTALNIMRYLARETDSAVWGVGMKNLATIRGHLDGTDGFVVFEKYSLRLLDNIYNTLGFEERPGDNYADHMLREDVLQVACRSRQVDCVRNARKVFRRWTRSRGKARPPGEQVGAVFCVGAESRRGWEFLWELYQQEKDSFKKEALLDGMSCTRDKVLILDWLERIENYDSEVKDAMLKKIMENQEGPDVVLEYLKKKQATISQTGTSIFNDTVRLAHKMKNKKQLEQLEELIHLTEKKFGTHPPEVAEALETATAALEDNQWREEHYADIMSWLEQQGEGNSGAGAMAGATLVLVCIMVVSDMVTT